LPLCPSGCLYPVFKGAKKRTSSKAAKEKATCSLAASLLAFGFPALLGCVKWQKNKNNVIFVFYDNLQSFISSFNFLLVIPFEIGEARLLQVQGRS